MNRISRYGLMLMAIAALSAAPSAWAACPQDTLQVGHIFGGTVINCPDDTPLEGYIWLLANPGTANSNGQNIVCRNENETTDGGAGCIIAIGSGVDGDDIVSVIYEWGSQNTGSVGCPNPNATGTAGVTPVGVQITCNNGATVMWMAGFDPEGSQQYILDLASPADEFGTPIPVSATFPNDLQITSVAAGPSPSAFNVCVHTEPATFLSDCDPTSLGGLNGFFTCPDPGVRPAAGRGLLMTQIRACEGVPDPRAVGQGWIQATNQPDAAGNACNVVDPPAGQCAFFGVQAQFGGVNGGGVTSYARVGNQPASDKVKIDGANTAQGKVTIDFSTTNELSILGFNVYSDGTKLNGTMIGTKGPGNNAYTFEVGRGALKGGKSVLVEAVKKDGTVEKTAPCRSSKSSNRRESFVMKKTYEKPAVIHSEKIEARAVTCSKSTDVCRTSGGPLTS